MITALKVSGQILIFNQITFINSQHPQKSHLHCIGGTEAASDIYIVSLI